MPRRARILVPGCPHHIVQRGHNRKAVFVSEEDHQYYLGNLAEWKTELHIKVYAWCLMTNHIHLVVEASEHESDISTLMKRVNGRQTAYTNRLERRSGSLWEGRFKASPIQRESYLLNCCRYVELNPVRAGMVDHANDYQWSSYRDREIGASKILDFDMCFESLCESHMERIQNYDQFLRDGISDDEKRFLSDSVNRNQLTGNVRFQDEIEERMGIRVESRGPGRPTKDGK